MELPILVLGDLLVRRVALRAPGRRKRVKARKLQAIEPCNFVAHSTPAEQRAMRRFSSRLLLGRRDRRSFRPTARCVHCDVESWRDGVLLVELYHVGRPCRSATRSERELRGVRREVSKPLCGRNLSSDNLFEIATLNINL